MTRDADQQLSSSAAIFSASPNDTGSLLFEFLTPTTYASSHPLAFLAEFQVHRRIHGIIGLFDAAEARKPGRSLSDAVKSFHGQLANLPTTTATKVYSFEPDQKQLTSSRQVDSDDELVMIPATGDVSFFLNTVLADFAGGVLREFSNMVSPGIMSSKFRCRGTD